MGMRASSDRPARILGKFSITALVFGMILLPLVGASAQSWVQLTPTGQAPVISPKNAVYDAGGNNMIVFGGGFIPRNNLTTVLSNANGLGGTPAWTQLSPSGQLP